jgi:hypothetical protein
MLVFQTFNKIGALFGLLKTILLYHNQEADASTFHCIIVG